MIVFLLIGRLKRSLRKLPSEKYRCGRCRRTFRHDARTVKAWGNGFRKFYCPECHAAWRCKKDVEQFARDQEYAGRSGCLGVVLLAVLGVENLVRNGVEDRLAMCKDKKSGKVGVI